MSAQRTTSSNFLNNFVTSPHVDSKFDYNPDTHEIHFSLEGDALYFPDNSVASGDFDY